jgi:hypothetical protein
MRRVCMHKAHLFQVYSPVPPALLGSEAIRFSARYDAGHVGSVAFAGCILNNVLL